MKYLIKENKNEVNLKELRNSLPGKNFFDTNPVNNVPISANATSSWEILEDPERFQKTYIFKDKREVIYFVNELYKYQFEINHHCKIIIDNLEVTIETYTHGFDGITMQDKKIKKLCDELFSDVNFFSEE